MKQGVNKNWQGACLAFYAIAAVMLPNLLLCFTEGMSWQANAVNLLLPLAFYMLLASIVKRPGALVWALFPSVFFAAFEIVLLQLFGSGVIAVDMFLNMVTSNASEMGELLGDMWPVLLFIVVLYVPLLVWGAIAWSKGVRLSPSIRKRVAWASLLIAVAGFAAMILAYADGPSSGIEGNKRYNPIHQIFPVNVAENACLAVDRCIKTNRYQETSAAFRYDAVDTHPADSVPELYILMIGETSRAENWQLAGYGRETNPRLSRREGMVFYPHVMSESNTTHKSVPMMLTDLSAEQFDSIYYRKGIIEAFNEAGYATAYISNQGRNGSFIDFFGEEADSVLFLKDNPEYANAKDMAMLSVVKGIISEGHPRQLIVMHTYGSHFKYNDRYPEEYRRFVPDEPLVANAKNRDRLINAYDNTILYTDALVDSVISLADASGARTAVIYAADHGEDIYDGGSDRFLHSSPIPTEHQLHVPMILWMSREYILNYPDKAAAAQANREAEISSSESVFHTLIDVAGLSTRSLKPELSVASDAYSAPPRRYITDHNRGVDYRTAGMKTD